MSQDNRFVHERHDDKHIPNLIFWVSCVTVPDMIIIILISLFVGGWTMIFDNIGIYLCVAIALSLLAIFMYAMCSTGGQADTDMYYLSKEDRDSLAASSAVSIHASSN